MSFISIGKLYGFLMLFFIASKFVTEMTTFILSMTILLLAIPGMLALGHRISVKRLLSVTQFHPSRSLHWLASRQFFSTILAVLLSVVLTGFVLIQSVMFEDFDWRLLFFAPIAYAIFSNIVGFTTQKQFINHIYAISWNHRLAYRLFLGAFSLLWVALSYYMTKDIKQPLQLTEAVYQLQQQWANAPSGVVRWMLDMGAWGKASVYLVKELPDAAQWKLVVTAFFAPLAVFGFLGISFNGLYFARHDFQQIFDQNSNAGDTVKPIRKKVTAAWVLMGIAVMITMLFGINYADLRLQSSKSIFALDAVPECEKIGAGVYKINTIDTIVALWKEADTKIAEQHGSICSKLQDVRAIAEPGVEKYLNWYFSLGAELTRTAATFTGSTEETLAKKFDEYIMSNIKIRSVMSDIANQQEKDLALLTSTQERIQATLRSNMIVLNEAQCKVTKVSSASLVNEKFSYHSERITASATAGLLAGVFAAKATTKALNKTSMKSASRVLMKALGKTGVSRAGAMAAGAATGAAVGSAVPFFGTAIGAVAGATAAFVATTAVDFSALKLEEKLTREQMKNDLLDAIYETIQPSRQAIGCKV